MKLLTLLPLTLLVASTSVACSSSNAGPTGTPDAATSTTQDSAAPAEDSAAPVTTDAGTLSFSTDIYTPIIEHHCIFCHGPQADGGPGSGVAFGKLDLSSVDAGYANLVNAPAAGEACGDIDGAAGPVRVVPGSAATSLLYLKVNGYTTAPPCGGAMPKSGEIPDGGQAVVVEQIQTWINQGAQP